MKKIFLPVILFIIALGLAYGLVSASGWVFRYTVLEIRNLSLYEISFYFIGGLALGIMSLAGFVFAFLCIFESKLLTDPPGTAEKPGIFQVKKGKVRGSEIKGAFDEKTRTPLN